MRKKAKILVTNIDQMTEADIRTDTRANYKIFNILKPVLEHINK